MRPRKFIASSFLNPWIQQLLPHIPQYSCSSCILTLCVCEVGVGFYQHASFQNRVAVLCFPLAFQKAHEELKDTQGLIFMVQLLTIGWSVKSEWLLSPQSPWVRLCVELGAEAQLLRSWQVLQNFNKCHRQACCSQPLVTIEFINLKLLYSYWNQEDFIFCSKSGVSSKYNQALNCEENNLCPAAWPLFVLYVEQFRVAGRWCMGNQRLCDMIHVRKPQGFLSPSWFLFQVFLKWSLNNVLHRIMCEWTCKSLQDLFRELSQKAKIKVVHAWGMQ